MALTIGAGVQLNIRNLEKSFAALQVLRGVDIQIQAGEFIAIVGKSGCGKSTLLRQIAGLETVTSGEINQDQQVVDGLNAQARIMFQDPRLLPWLSVLENVGVGIGLCKGWEEIARNALKQVGLEDRAKEWPSVLSGGQKQRVALARALAAEPRLLLLDEPLGALDALTRYDMQSLIEGVWQERGFTALLVTHDVSEAIMLADRVILVEDGRIKLSLNVPMARPRNRALPGFVELEKQLLSGVLGYPESASNVQKTRETKAV